MMELMSSVSLSPASDAVGTGENMAGGFLPDVAELMGVKESMFCVMRGRRMEGLVIGAEGPGEGADTGPFGAGGGMELNDGCGVLRDRGGDLGGGLEGAPPRNLFWTWNVAADPASSSPMWRIG